MSILFLFISLIQWQPLTATHTYHVSHAKIEYAAEQQEWQISIQLFIDDLEAALKNSGTSKLHLGMKREKDAADNYILTYLNQHLKLKDNNGETLPCQWLGKEITEDMASFWIYLYVEDASPEHIFQIENRLFTEIYEDQQNVVHLYYSPSQERQFLFNKDYWKEEVGFE